MFQKYAGRGYSSKPFRKSQRIVSEIINKLNNDRVGVIAYAASALPILPITDDYSTAKTFYKV